MDQRAPEVPPSHGSSGKLCTGVFPLGLYQICILSRESAIKKKTPPDKSSQGLRGFLSPTLSEMSLCCTPFPIIMEQYVGEVYAAFVLNNIARLLSTSSSHALFKTQTNLLLRIFLVFLGSNFFLACFHFKGYVWYLQPFLSHIVALFPAKLFCLLNIHSLGRALMVRVGQY